MAKDVTNNISWENKPKEILISLKTIAASKDKAEVKALGVWTIAILIISKTKETILIWINKGLFNSKLYKGIQELNIKY